ncbi:Rieske 2Fe-2S domain-containing protein [Luteibacter pinisoli]|uniref:Rieske 2Fe-2S domain-containing protein n=1 Tax=Luteibacter pinisoli TaxID=2589080 RepID=A0A4Y5Z1G7_9GAMM|nr:FAD-dependent oxidoreductase [Luteibacter pinisoli]QDE38338.1 Rieske 2Fe-2S domain-containing protein [Luteibacter pinisoli]
MSESADKPSGPDFTQGVPAGSIPTDGVLKGHVGDDAVIVARTADGLAAITGTCSHYGGDLAEGLRVGDTIHCPLHHACFDLASGRALRAPALSPVDRWKVDERDGKVFVTEKLAAPGPAEPTDTPSRKIVIIGGGAAGFAAAQRLRDLGFDGSIILLSDDTDAPYDRPNASKDFLAGTAQPEWMPLKDEAFYKDNDIDLRLGVAVDHVNAEHCTVTLDTGERLDYDTLLLCTGAEPIRPDGPGFDGPDVFTVRTMADAQAIIDAAEGGGPIAVVGSSFIGLEVAASLRERGVDVHLIGPDEVPLKRVLGDAIGQMIRTLHEAHGVNFHLGRKATGYVDGAVTLDDGSCIKAAKVVLGIGVRPRIGLAEAAGLDLDNGVLVDATMRTSNEDIYAAGDIARFPGLDDSRQRVEHWVVAERQGQVAAAAMLDIDEIYNEAPFFWSVHYDTSIRYVGHATEWDDVEVVGSIADKDAEVRFKKNGRELAVATINRDKASLEAAERLANA